VSNARPKVSDLGAAEEQLARLVTLYRNAFGFEFRPEDVHIPDHPPEWNRLIVAHNEELKLNRIVQGLKKSMDVWTYEKDLDSAVTRASYLKRSVGLYGVWVRERQEADEELANRSALDLERDSVNILTAEERLLYEAIYHGETGNHLDQKNWTLTGSRDSVGGAVDVGWYSEDRWVRVCWTILEIRDGPLRAREAVS